MSCFVGIDVHLRKDLCLAALDAQGRMVASGWYGQAEILDAIRALRREHGRVHVGIDAPRRPLPRLRAWYWTWNGWTTRSNQKGHGRHCEVVVAALGLANPQWTPLEPDAPAWMRVGFALFEALADEADSVHEAFPSAAYTQLSDSRDVSVTIDFTAFAPGPKDAADACVAAATVREVTEGRGGHVGDGDGLGSIVLPRPVERHPVLEWPE